MSDLEIEKNIFVIISNGVFGIEEAIKLYMVDKDLIWKMNLEICALEIRLKKSLIKNDLENCAWERWLFEISERGFEMIYELNDREIRL